MRLHYAAKWGDVETIRHLVAQGRSIDGVALQFAIESPHATAETIKSMIEMGADPNATGRWGEPLLFLPYGESKTRALLEGGADIEVSLKGYTVLTNERPYDIAQLRLLLDVGANPNLVGLRGETALEYALRTGNPDAVALLLKRGAKLELTGLTPLQLAVYLGTLDDVERGLSAGGAPHERGLEWLDDPWTIALRQGHLDKARALFTAGADPLRLDDRERTSLIIAAQADQPEIVRWLIGLGAPIEAHDWFGTALVHASSRGATRSVAALIEARADVHTMPWTRTQAIDAAKNIEIVRLLVAQGSDVNHVDGGGNCVLREAARNGDFEFVQDLIALGVDLEASMSGQTALDNAVWVDERHVVRLLLDAGADPNTRDHDGWTPLYGVKSIETARMLLAAGADPYTTDDFGHTAIDHTNDPELRAVLSGDF